MSTTEQTAPAKETADEKKAREAAEAAAKKAAEQLAEGSMGVAITNAQTMMKAKRKIQADLQAARDFLNQGITVGAVNAVQRAWIEENLPKRTRVRGE